MEHKTYSDVMGFLFFFFSFLSFFLNEIIAVHCDHIGFILTGNLQKSTCLKFNDVQDFEL